MNKIYKVIWSKIKNCYVVTSEIAKSRSKAGRSLHRSTGRLLTLGVLLSLCSGIALPQMAWADPVINGSGTIHFYGNYSPEDVSSTGNVFGVSNTASGDYSTAFGMLTTASGEKATAWGHSTAASGEGSTGWGAYTVASGDYSTAWGIRSVASGNYSSAWGTDAEASGQYSTAWNYGKASGESSTAWSFGEATGKDSTAWSNGKATAEDSTAWNQGEASAMYSVAWNHGEASGERSTAFNHGKAQGWGSTAWQYGTASGDRATAWGGLDAGGQYAGGTASGLASTAWGVETTASGSVSTVFGEENTADGYGSTSWGTRNTAEGFFSTAYGGGNTAEGYYSTASGYDNIASGDISMVFGQSNTASGATSAAWGFNSTASGDSSTAWGQYTNAAGSNTTTWGWDSEAYGVDSTAFGDGSKAYGSNSLAALGGRTGISATWNDDWGEYETEGGANAAAIGMSAIAQLDDSVALGSYAVASTEAGAVGYDPSGKLTEEEKAGATWTSTYNAVAVGDAANEVTRQITGVAAGTEDTDAVNVAQLKAVVSAVPSIHYYSVNDGGVQGGNYDNDGATGVNALAAGVNASASGDNAVAIGNGSTANGDNSVALMGTTVNGTNAIAWGNGNVSGQDGFITSRGYYNNRVYSVTVADNEDVYKNTTAFGEANIATNNNATVFGNGNIAAGTNSTATGEHNVAGGKNSFVSGRNNTAGGVQEDEYGSYVYDSSTNRYAIFKDSGENAAAFGEGNIASGDNSFAIGYNNQASGEGSFAAGKYSRATGSYAVVFGDRNDATGENAMSWGAENYASGTNATAFGEYTFATGRAATSWGIEDTEAAGDYSTAWGFSKAYGDFSTSFGGGYDHKSQAIGRNSLAALGGTTGVRYYDRTMGDYVMYGGENAVAIGTEAVSEGESSVTFMNGYASEDAVRGMAWGDGEVYATNATAFGSGSEAYGENSTAFGSGSEAYGENSTAIGYLSYAYGDNSLAALGGETGVGTWNNETQTYDIEGGENAAAIGYGAVAELDDSVALGSWAVANTEAGAVGYDPSGKLTEEEKANSTWTSTYNAIAVGDAENDVTRQITGVAAGTEDTDAVNVAQLKAVVSAVPSIHYYSVNDGGVQGGNYDNDGATGVNALAAGVNASASGDNAVAIGNGSTANGDNSVALMGTTVNGTNAIAWGHGIADGENSTAWGDGFANQYNATAWGSYNTADGENATAFGYSTAAFGFNATSFGGCTVAEGLNSTAFGCTTVAVGDQATAFGQGTLAMGNNSTAFGYMSETYGVNSTAFGYISKAYGADSTAFGDGSIAYGNNSLAALGGKTGINATWDADRGAFVPEGGANAAAIGFNSEARLNHSVALGSFAVANTEAGAVGYDPTGKLTEEEKAGATWTSTYNAIAIGDAANNVTRQITGVAAGTEDTDAVNVAQLKAATLEAASKHTEVKAGENVASVVKTVDEADGHAIYTVNVVDMRVASGEVSYEDNGSGNIILHHADDTTVSITGLKNTYTNTDGVYNETTKVATFTNNDGSTYNLDLSALDKKASAHNTVTSESGNIDIKETTNQDGGINYDLDIANNIIVGGKDGEAGSIGVAGKDGKDGVSITAKDGVDGVDGAEGHIGLNGKDGVTDIYTSKGTPGVDGKDGITRIIYKDPDGTEHEVATKDDGLNFAGDDGIVIAKKLNEQLDIKGGAKGTLTDSNIGVVNENGALSVKLAEKVVLGTEGSVTAGDTTIDNKGLTVGGNTYVTNEGINANNKVITNVAPGTADTDAVNVSQLKEYSASARTEVRAGQNVTSVVKTVDKTDGHDIYTVNVKDTTNKELKQSLNGSTLTTSITDTEGKTVENSVDLGSITTEQGNRNTAMINKLDSKVNKVGARAAALAALHPLDFDPDDKLNFAAGYGHYRGENAAALGVFYRPDEKTMFHVSGTLANHDNMINAGVSFSLDRTARVTNTKTAMAKDILQLKAENTELKAQMAQMMNIINKLGLVKDYPVMEVEMFPDIPENHWAYEYIEGLQKAGIVEGYPDGNFSGDRSMTRYEFGAMLWRALKAGQVLPEKLAAEFKDEIGRFRVDRVHGADDKYHKYERIRVNGDPDFNRDAYGSVQGQPPTSRGPQDVYPNWKEVKK